MTGALAGVRVVVTRPPDRARKLASLLEQRGAEALVVPVFRIDPPSSPDALDESLRSLADGAFDWVVVASVNGARALLARSKELGVRLDEVGARLAAVGPATAEVLQRGDALVDLVPEVATMTAVAAGLGGGRVLFLRVEDGPEEARAALAAAGCDVHEVAAYRNVPVPLSGDDACRVTAGEFDVMTFASPSAARHLAATVSPGALDLARGSDGDKAVVCIGPSTAAGAEEAGWRVDEVASEHTAAGLVDAIERLYRRRRRGVAP